MALPNSYTNDNDTLATVSWETHNNNLLNLMTVEGEKVLAELAGRGRVFGVKDAEQWVQPFYYQSPGDDTYRGVATGTFGTGATLGVTSKEIVSKTLWSFFEWQNNVIWPSTMIETGTLDFHMARAKAKMAEILQREECLFLRGSYNASTPLTSTLTANAPHSGDTSFDSTNYNPMSLLGLYTLGCAKGGVGGDKSANKFAGVKEDDTSQWAPTVVAGTANGSNLEEDIQNALGSATFGSARPNYGLTSFAVWRKLSALIRQYSAIQVPTSADVVKNPNEALMFAGIPFTWSRFLADTSAEWDLTDGVTAGYFLGLLDLNSLRVNVPISGNEVEGLSFVRRISNVQVQEQQTQHFYRIAAKRAYVLENGRRSFGYVDGITLA